MIREFRGKWSWLSNFKEVTINYNGIQYSSVEHAYQAQKSNDIAWQKYCSLPTVTGAMVKNNSKTITLRSDWDLVKVGIMQELLLLKFLQQPFKNLLIESGDNWIMEGNNWGDKFWGVCLKTNKGDNMLGKLIMNIREELKNENVGEV